jgi:WD40 repeat protein
VIQDQRSQERDEPKPEKVSAVIQATGEKVTASIEPDWWLGADKGDVAILRLEGGLPFGTQPLQLGSSGETSGHSFKTYGFPDARAVEGLWGYGTIGDSVPEAGRYLLQLTNAAEITPGFSGAPVLDNLTRRIVGMVTAITAPDQYGRLAQTAFITPSEVLRSVSPLLELSDICPYLSLDAFSENDSEFFFGRQKFIERLLESLRHEPKFLAVLGPSGSGKSSVVKAGLLPRLWQGAVPGSDRWGIIVIRPADNPFKQLSEKSLEGEDLLKALSQWSSHHPDNNRILMILDQFEEIMTTSPEKLSQAFISQMVQALNSDLPVTMIVIMRDDFYSRLANRSPELMEWIERGLINIPLTLEKEDLISIVEDPAKTVGLRLEAGLVDAIVEDVLETSPFPGENRPVGRSTALPLLEFALTELWRRRQDGLLTLKAYKDLGGVTGGLAQWADNAYYSLEESLRPAARRILTSLVHLREEGKGVPDSKRRLSPTDLCLASHCRDDNEREIIYNVIRRLTDKRLLVTSAGMLKGQETVEIIHEALIREWGLMRQWLNEDRLFLGWRQKLNEKVDSWMESSPEDATVRDDDRLLRGRDLAEAEGWLEDRKTELSQDEVEYISASLAFRDKETKSRRNRRRQIVAGLIAAIIITSSLAIIAYSKSLQASQQSQIAEQQSKIAFSRQLAAQADVLRTQKADSLQSSVILAYESMKLNASLEADQTLRRGLSLLPVQVAHMVHEDGVKKVTFSPDGRLVADASDDYTARIWNDTGSSEFSPLVHHGVVRAIVFSKDGKYLATASDDGSAILWNTSNKSKILTIHHEDAVNDVAISPNARLVATASMDRTIKVLDTMSGIDVFNRSFDDPVNIVRFSPDGLQLAVASYNIVYLLDIANGQELIQLAHDDEVTAISFSNDSKRIASASWDKTARIWDTTTGKEIAIMAHDGWIWDIDFSPDGDYVVSASEDGTARIWNSSSGQEVTRLPHESWVNAVAFSQNGKYIASASDDNTARVWEPVGGREVKRLIHENSVWDVAFSPDGRYIATASADNTSRVWNLTEEPGELSLFHENEVYDVIFSPDGKYIATCGLDNTSRIWDSTSGKEIGQLLHNGFVRLVKFSPDGKLLATASEDDTARVWDFFNDTSRTIEHDDDVLSVDFSPQGKYIASSSVDKTAKVLEVAGGAEVAVVAHDDIVNWITFSPDGKYIATSSVDRTARIWNSLSGHMTARLASDSIVNAVAFSPDGTYIATASDDGTARVWLVSSKRQVSVLQHNDKVYSITFSPDGENLATACADNNARIWDYKNGTEKLRMRCGGSVWSIAFTRDGRYLATGSREDDTARVWDAMSGKQLALFAHNGDVYAVSFSPDGKYLASASRDKTARVWLWQKDPTRNVCSYLTSNLGEDQWRQYAGSRSYEKTCPDLP